MNDDSELQSSDPQSFDPASEGQTMSKRLVRRAERRAREAEERKEREENLRVLARAAQQLLEKNAEFHNGEMGKQNGETPKRDGEVKKETKETKRHHMVTRGRVKKKNFMGYECVFDGCDVRLGDVWKMTKHWEKTHLDEKKEMKCPHCKRKFEDRKVFSAHVWLKHDDDRDVVLWKVWSNLEGYYECPICALDVMEFEAHMEKHHGPDE